MSPGRAVAIAVSDASICGQQNNFTAFTEYLVIYWYFNNYGYCIAWDDIMIFECGVQESCLPYASPVTPEFA
jgi:hypothetical protein